MHKVGVGRDDIPRGSSRGINGIRGNLALHILSKRRERADKRYN